jgi:hypothetical protein
MPTPRRYHRAHDTELRQWAEAGDLRAEFEQLHRGKIRQMVDDLAANPQTSLEPPDYVVHLSKNLGLRVQKGGTLVVLSLILDERTPKQAILHHWDEINAWQERLRKWQGPWNSEERYIANVAPWHGVWRSGRTTADPSYATLAQWVNNGITTNLAIFVASLQLEPPPGHRPAFERLLDVPSWSVPSDHWASGLFEAIKEMEAWGMSSEAIRDYCLRALDALTEAWTEVRQREEAHTFDGWWKILLDHVESDPQPGNPFQPDQPIDRERIIDKLKQRRRQRPH